MHHFETIFDVFLSRLDVKETKVPHLGESRAKRRDAAAKEVDSPLESHLAPLAPSSHLAVAG